MLFNLGSCLLIAANVGLNFWMGWAVLAQADAIPIGQLITGGGSLGINAVIVIWFVNHLNAVRTSNETRIAEIVTAHKEEVRLRDDQHAQALKERSDQHAQALREVIASVREGDKETNGLMRDVLRTITAFQQKYGLDMKRPEGT